LRCGALLGVRADAGVISVSICVATLANASSLTLAVFNTSVSYACIINAFAVIFILPFVFSALLHTVNPESSLGNRSSKSNGKQSKNHEDSRMDWYLIEMGSAKFETGAVSLAFLDG
jgi:hypothetical protein